MLVAKEKRKENIAGYILYMFQVEDLIRAFQFDDEKLEEFVVRQYASSEAHHAEIIDWYKNLSMMMVKEGVKEKGHLQVLDNLINDLESFHLKVSQSEDHQEYKALHKSVAGLIKEFNDKSKKDSGEIGACINALYMYLMLKLQKKEVSAETTGAMKSFGKLLSKLSSLYKDFEEGNIEL